MHFTIVSYTFPPSKEIGGRRWAKFSHYLAKMGHSVTVICSDNSAASEWYEKDFPGIEFKLLPKRYPDWLSGHTKSIIEKLYYFILVRILSPFTKHNLFDRGFAWRKQLLNALEEVHNTKNINVLVATGAPFSLLYYGSEFKRRHKEIFYITDFRDPWTWAKGYYGISNMSSFKKKYQEFSEYNTICYSDIVCCPTENMCNFLKEKYPNFSSKLYLLPHAYEPDKFPKTTEEEKRKGFIYGGTLYNGIEDYVKKIANVLKSNPDSGFKWTIYTGTSYPLLDDANFTKGNILKQPFVPEEQLFREIKKSAVYLALFPESDKDLISTKFFEIIYAETPILYIGEEGDVAKFIREKRVGVHILPENIEKELPKYLSGNVPFEHGYFDVSQYSFYNVTMNFLKAIENFKSDSHPKNTSK